MNTTKSKVKKLILASQSPRRKNIMLKAGFEFDIIPSVFDETLENDVFSPEKIEKLAYNKALDIAEKISGEALVIGADTVVVLDGKILGKPENKTEAFKMLKMLSGKVHSVVTAICVINSKDLTCKSNLTTSFVEFQTLTDEQILNYIEKFNPVDKAGSYGIQELDKSFIKNVEGSVENVIGLCSKSLTKLIEK